MLHRLLYYSFGIACTLYDDAEILIINVLRLFILEKLPIAFWSVSLEKSSSWTNKIFLHYNWNWKCSFQQSTLNNQICLDSNLADTRHGHTVVISTYKGIFMFVCSVSKGPVLMSFHQSEFDCWWSIVGLNVTIPTIQ